jgi:hypothetical protein
VVEHAERYIVDKAFMAFLFCLKGVETMELLIGAGLIVAGYLLCYFTAKKPIQSVKELYTEVKRVKPSFRNPTKTYDVNYDKFKIRESGLYGPVKPKGGDS